MLMCYKLLGVCFSGVSPIKIMTSYYVLWLLFFVSKKGLWPWVTSCGFPEKKMKTGDMCVRACMSR